jgi:pyruvate,water dikinase
MKWIIPAAEVQTGDKPRVGGKGFVLGLLARNGFRLPETLCIGTDAYRAYVRQTGLRERILMELNRKDFKEMRWEEVWDCATRIRSMFLQKALPVELASSLRKEVAVRFADKAVAVRSSAPEEDDAQASFAGLHESFLNVRGSEDILLHIRLVWASLWSDAALLYRQEIGLDPKRSAMAVVIQETIAGECSGVAFTRSPNSESQGVVEAVYGLNQGLVDGTVEPDRWTFDRRTRRILSHAAARRESRMVPDERGVRLTDLPEELALTPPLTEPQAGDVFELACRAEDFFEAAQDVEWTYAGEKLYLLQARPITTHGADGGEDKRSWYLSLHRSFDNLKVLRRKIEDEHIPRMVGTAREFSAAPLSAMSHRGLEEEIQRRWEINHHWVNVYWTDFIPFAHGIRLFGQVYNQLLRPDNPYEFVDLLTRTDMASLERNRMLADLAERVRRDPELAGQIRQGDLEGLKPEFRRRLAAFIEKFGDLSCAVTGGTQCVEDSLPLLKIVAELAEHPPLRSQSQASLDVEARKEAFLSAFETAERHGGRELLDLARASYRLRDDDNIHLGRIESGLLAALQEANRRIAAAGNVAAGDPQLAALKKTVENIDFKPVSETSRPEPDPRSEGLRARQLIGQPAGPGLAIGRARVIRHHPELQDFKNGEILVCDAVDPNMTFVVPLAAGVVERRGGMLIHGAIIAREYGLPCVTGVPEATTMIRTGDELTVDGFLGIVTLGSKAE